MSQLDSMLKELQKTLSDDVTAKTATIGREMSSDDASALIKSQSLALRDFLKQNVSTVAAGVPQESDDPQVVLARRTALSSFVGIPLKNEGKPILPGTITETIDHSGGHGGGGHGHGGGGHGAANGKNGHGSGSGNGNGNGSGSGNGANTATASKTAKAEGKDSWVPAFAPAPQVVLKYVDGPCKKCEEHALKEKEEKKSESKLGVGGSATASSTAASNASSAAANASSGSATNANTGASSSSTSGAAAKSGEKSSAPSAQAQGTGNATPAPATAGAHPAAGMQAAAPKPSWQPAALGGNSGTFSKPVIAKVEPEEEKVSKPEVEEPKGDKETAKDVKGEKKGGFGLFNVFGGKKEKTDERSKPEERKAENESAAPSSAPSPAPARTTTVMGSNANAAAQVAWFKHIQAIEAALRMGDVHFADCLLSLLVEVAHSVTASGNIKARLDSMQARIHIDRKLYTEAEEILQKAIKNAEGTPLEKNISIAYCWHAMAQSYHAQRKIPEAEKARKTAIDIATEALGENDPETMLLKAPL